MVDMRTLSKWRCCLAQPLELLEQIVQLGISGFQGVEQAIVVAMFHPFSQCGNLFRRQADY